MFVLRTVHFHFLLKNVCKVNSRKVVTIFGDAAVAFKNFDDWFIGWGSKCGYDTECENNCDFHFEICWILTLKFRKFEYTVII